MGVTGAVEVRERDQQEVTVGDLGSIPGYSMDGCACLRYTAYYESSTEY